MIFYQNTRRKKKDFRNKKGSFVAPHHSVEVTNLSQKTVFNIFMLRFVDCVEFIVGVEFLVQARTIQGHLGLLLELILFRRYLPSPLLTVNIVRY